ncbi:phage head completion protein [Alkalicoccobacillus gibsonii]|uniref:phage head completion protein n=1 Tax=Alkalicoccobacillus gibsonii TaxID=79881 RepID=UPI0019321075|nr:head-tail adaptor protein [Alkalicoccobacillus gibsonii]MBM0064779.1 head-tail adaptor protein [Alkalicoccobacillus gibsonii]
MRKFEYKPPRLHSGELRTPIEFWGSKPNPGPMPDSTETKVYSTWAKVDQVWLRDLETAKANGTLSDITISIRDPQSSFIPSNLHLISIDSPEYKGKKYNIKQVQPDLQNKQFISIIAQVSK